jgi:acetyl-CoA/propionyl-CoA carboxylase biotin carboxyl carrier protein
MAVDLGLGRAQETFLSIERMVDAARTSNADAVHPGYGFLSEQAEFAEAVIDAGMTWVGPPPSAIRMLSDKVAAKQVAMKVGAPVAGGPDEPVTSAASVVELASKMGLPLVLKAAFGGGGRGMRVIRSLDECGAAFDAARRESISAFGREELFVERYLERPRHVEVQVLGDLYGRVVVVGTRDCSLQRRYQKIVEEAPAPFLSDTVRAEIAAAAVAICREAGYVSAGTVEFLVSDDDDVAFMEVNTRLQVEHPVTEVTSGLDLAVAQLRIASGEPIWWEGERTPMGHAIEFRINAEDPGIDFMPSVGRLTSLALPSGPGVRVDAGIECGGEVDPNFDSMIAKVIVSGATREEAIARSRRALGECVVSGVATLLDVHKAILDHGDFGHDDPDRFAVHTTWIERELLRTQSFQPYSSPADEATVMVGGRAMRALLPDGLQPGTLDRKEKSSRRADALGGAVLAPMQGTVTSLYVSDGSLVREGEPICGVEAMKMENLVRAPVDGVVSGLSISLGMSVRRSMVLCHVIPTTTMAEQGES